MRESYFSFSSFSIIASNLASSPSLILQTILPFLSIKYLVGKKWIAYLSEMSLALSAVFFAGSITL